MLPQRLLQDDIFRSIVSNTPVQNVVVSVLIIFAAFILSRILQRLVPRYIEEPERRYKITKVIGRTVAVTAGLAIIVLWSIGETDIITLLTVVGAGLAIALREVLLSLVGWINIVVRSPFKHGDRVEVNGVRGDVIDVRLFHSTLMEIGGWVDADQSTGRIVHIPNAWIYQFEVYNYTRGFGFVWNEIPFTVTYRSDWQAARDIILDLASETADLVEHQVKNEIKRVSSEYLIHYSILSPFVYVKIVNNGVQLCLRYLTEVRKRRGTEHALTLSVLEAFAEHGQIEMAYAMSSMAPYDSPQFGPFPGTRGDGTPPAAGKKRAGRRGGGA